jgi:hypothetical protein
MSDIADDPDEEHIIDCELEGFFSNPYFTPDLIGEPLTNRIFSYIKVFGLCPSPRASGGCGTHNLGITSHKCYRSATR